MKVTRLSFTPCLTKALAAFLIVSFWSSSSFAGEIVLTKLYQRNEISRKGGVLVAQPRAIDLEIIHLIRTNQIKTLDDYARWLEGNIRYQKDITKDSWSAPGKTLRSRSADCEDFTLLNMAVLRVLGFQPQFLTLKRGKYSHAVCAFKVQDHYYWFDNYRLKKTTARTLSDLAKHISAQHNYNQILTWDDARKNWTSLYKNS